MEPLRLKSVVSAERMWIGNMPTKRYFVPSHATVGRTMIPTCIHHYEYTRSRGLRVYDTRGMTWKSDYTLPELIKTKEAIEITPEEYYALTPVWEPWRKAIVFRHLLDKS